jgi:hypothetical protein
MPEQDPKMQLLEQLPVADFNEPQVASQHHERFNAAHNTFRRIGAVAGATLALTGAAMADRPEGPLGTEPAQAALVDTDPVYKAKLAKYDLSEYPKGYFDNGIPKDFINRCMAQTILPPENTTIKYANRAHSRVRITSTVNFYKEKPECEMAGKLTVKVWQAIVDKNNRTKRNTPVAALPIHPGKNRASVVLPTYKKDKCTWKVVMRTGFAPIRGTGPGKLDVPLFYNNGDLVDWHRCLPKSTR